MAAISPRIGRQITDKARNKILRVNNLLARTPPQRGRVPVDSHLEKRFQRASSARPRFQEEERSTQERLANLPEITSCR
jgi:hypothetical protein